MMPLCNDLVDVLGDYKPVFKCKLCDNPEEFFDHLYRHSVNHSGVEQQRVTCNFCGKNMHEHSLTGQINQQHVTKEGHTKCKRCYKDIPTENLPSHECETFSCEECGKVRKSKKSLRNHRQLKHEFREVKKEICKIFGLSDRDLNRHMKIHVEEDTLSRM